MAIGYISALHNTRKGLTACVEEQSRRIVAKERKGEHRFDAHTLEMSCFGYFGRHCLWHCLALFFHCGASPPISYAAS